jgi:hypothetical protein
MRQLVGSSIIRAALILSSCGGDSDGGGDAASDEFEGIYRTTSHTLTTEACEGEAKDVEDGDEFFKLRLQSILGQNILNYFTCSDATTCEDADIDENTITFSQWTVSEKSGTGWKGDSSSVSSSGLEGAECYLNIGTIVATRTDAGVVTYEKTSQSGKVEPIAGKDCIDAHDELIDLHRSTLACSSIETFSGEAVD